MALSTSIIISQVIFFGSILLICLFLYSRARKRGHRARAKKARRPRIVIMAPTREVIEEPVRRCAGGR